MLMDGFYGSILTVLPVLGATEICWPQRLGLTSKVSFTALSK